MQIQAILIIQDTHNQTRGLTVNVGWSNGEVLYGIALYNIMLNNLLNQAQKDNKILFQGT